MEFFALRDSLLREGRTFDATALRELAYGDLIRAAVGDAGEAMCSLELVREERRRRISEETMAIRMSVGPRLIQDHDLYDAALRALHQRPTPPPEWDTLSLVTQGYLLLRCLRAHMDDPADRLDRLKGVLATLASDGADYRVKAMALMMVHFLPAMKEDLARNGALDILTFRKHTFDLFRVLRQGVPLHEEAVCSHLEVIGYHCTLGCFTPGATE